MLLNDGIGVLVVVSHFVIFQRVLSDGFHVFSVCVHVLILCSFI